MLRASRACWRCIEHASPIRTLVRATPIQSAAFVRVSFSFAPIISVLLCGFFLDFFSLNSLCLARSLCVFASTTAIDVGELPFPRLIKWVVEAKSTMAQAAARLPPTRGYTLLRMHALLALSRVRLAFECAPNLRALPDDGALENAALFVFVLFCSVFC